ncbi:CBPC2-like protein [Mya arenaria]|uniref:CBPC2-like protein n=1 Tax=Mya arenaria TaxID=6604 RepID=A0ABY7DYN9_MYAAR|nr:CBPC2-like protein [Mya arenaria]
MYPITKSATQFGFSAITGVADTADNMEEYVYADDPKDGNDSSAEDTRDNSLPGPPPSQRLTKSAGPAVSYMRTQARRLHREKQGLDPNACDENEEDCFTIPWRLIPEDIVEDLEFYKNADNVLRDQIQRTTQLVFVEKEGKGMVPKLKDPINLFPKELGPQQAARWPADIQVIEKKIKHIPYVPQEPEPFYKLTGTEKTPMVRGEDRGGRLVYMYEPRSTFFVRSRVGGIKAGPEQCAISIDRSQDDTTLIFESRFESGNLARAVQVSEFEYELQLRYDLYTSKHTQWFYFSVSNTRPNKQYRFTIINFMKPDSLYNYGMKPVQYSEKDALKKIGWRRHGVGIKYYKNNTKYETSKGDKSFYSLTWTTEFNHSNDTVYLAHCFPYTYTDLQDYLLDLQNDPIKSKICKQRVLCRTLAGNLVYLLTITSPSANPEDMKLLRDTFIFKIVPMLNPDGVIVGNYRCSLAGRDLNRNYKTVLKDAYPTVWHTKQMIRRLLQEREIVAYCDLHGHSRRQNVFIYGCENRHNAEKRLRERIFPCMLDKNSPDKFTFDACKFKVQKSKEGTGRIVMWNMGILNSYTMEATFCGSTLGKKKGLHFTTRDFEEMGYDFCDTLLDYCDPDNTKSANVLYDLEENLKQEIRKKLELRGVHVENVPKKKKKLKTRKERDKVKESGKDVGKKGDKEKQVLTTIQNDNDYLEQLTSEYIRKGIMQKQHETNLQLEDLVRGQAGIGGGGGVSPTPGSAAQTERRHSRHLIEVSEDRKRQEMLQQQRRPEKSASKTHSDEKLGGLSSRLKAQIPSATFVNYDTFKISQMNIDSAERQEEFTRSEELNGKDIVDEAGKREGQNKGHRHSGRKSRMHDSEEEEELETREGPDYVQDPHLHRPPRVKSARTGGEDMNSAIQSIKDLRQSLATSAASNTNLSPTAGNYIKKLLKQELRQTDEDIGEITARLQRNIDKKQEQYDEMLHHQQQQQQPQGSAVNTSQGQANPRPVPDQNPKPPDPRVRADKKETIKKDVPKSERREPTVLKGATKSMTNLNGNAVNEGAMLNSKLVDTYHIPDSNHSQGHKQDGFRGGKLETDYGQPKQVKNGISYSSATDLAQPQFYQNEPVTRMIRQGVNGVPRSASSSSSREESEPRSVSTTLDKNDRDRNENVQRVKSAKNSSRQVVETIPTKISLMITHDHDDRSFAGNQFLPLTRTLRGPFNKSANLPSKRK